MADAIHKELRPEDGLRNVLKLLLEDHRVEGVLTLSRIEGGKVAYALVSDPGKLDESVPLYPLMPTNLGQVLDRLTRDGASPRKLAVVVHPCELRGFVEMVKRRQGRLGNLYFISHSCGGVFPTSSALTSEIEEKVLDYWEAVRQDKIHPDLRPACRSCVEFIPYTADLTLRVVDGPGGFVLIANGERGKDLIDGLPNIEWGEDELDRTKITQMREARSENRARSFARDANQAGLGGLVSVFGRCIGCHACSKACPICHCNLCTFESTLFERGPMDHDRALMVRKGLRLPPDTIFFHLGRMVHMATSCVACGSCQDVCPVDIPVSIIFKKVGESLQKTFDYVPGKDLDQPLPVTAFEVEEFLDIEGKER